VPTISDYIHDGEFYDELNKDTADLAFYRRECHAAAGPVLELCCGTGRLTIPLGLDGIAITGVDRSPSMLQRARAKLTAAGLTVPLHEADIRDLRLDSAFDSVFIPFNSLQCIYEIDDVGRVFNSVKHHLAPDGRLIFDVFNPSIDFLVERQRGWHPVRSYTDAGGRDVEVTEQCHYDAAAQINHVTWRIIRDGLERLEQLDMRCFFPCEMEALIRLSGFRSVVRYGDFDETPFTSESPKQICVCEPV